MKISDINTIAIQTRHPSLDGFAVLQISDLHINTKTKVEDIKNLVQSCNELQYDILLITGDIIDCKAKLIENQLAILNNLKGKVYYISGNHDLFYGLQELQTILSHLQFLDNKVATLTYKETLIHLAGLGDRFSRFFGYKRDTKLLNTNSEDKKLKILAAHQPKDYKFAVQYNYDLFLCGHTHGGQIWPFHYLVKLVQPFINGLHYIKNCAIYVNKGIGTWGIGYRFKANSEIALLRFTYENIDN